MEQIKLKLVSIFHTLDGECTIGGPLQWSTFVRTGGCNLRCWKSSGFCDAPHSLQISYPWRQWELEDIVTEVQKNLPCKRVTITGGEPLVQRKGVVKLADELLRLNYIVTLETSGSIEIRADEIMKFSSIIMDVKPPSTEMEKFNKWQMMQKLRDCDYVKFVLSDRKDYEWAIEYLEEWHTFANVAFGPRFGCLEPRELVEWMRQDRRYDIRLNLQTHKYIWPECEPDPVDDLSKVKVIEMSQLER